jgi:hypothetical protein
MHTSKYWVAHFTENARHKRINWGIAPSITQDQIGVILKSLQAWQLGETSEGAHLLAASEKYAAKIGDPEYIDAVKLFIKEEQKHGYNLGRYIDKINRPRVSYNWGDALFRKVRYFNTNMELWTLAVIVVESTAQLFYQSLRAATGCRLLKDICRDILIDEAHHITFQTERLAIIFEGKSEFSRAWRKVAYRYFFYATAGLVWFAHRKLFKAGGLTFEMYVRKMRYKYAKTVKSITTAWVVQLA